ncbi:hypothetical protein OIV83_005305 [Microbotryomycetes sp. JL201]|nr:hypothetical protein OIV83_005305 [Microbotryomycetes sp. JL201]
MASCVVPASAPATCSTFGENDVSRPPSPITFPEDAYQGFDESPVYTPYKLDTFDGVAPTISLTGSPERTTSLGGMSGFADDLPVATPLRELLEEQYALPVATASSFGGKLSVGAGSLPTPDVTDSYKPEA